MAFTAPYFISTYKQAAFAATYKTGLLPSVLLAIAVDTSDAGNKPCSKICNNHFEIKPAQNSHHIRTWRVDDSHYIIYNDPYQCFHASVQLLKKWDRKKETNVFRAKKPETQLAKIATLLGMDETWQERLLQIIAAEMEGLDEEGSKLHKEWKEKASD